jgi:hypothetical protein
MSFNHSPKITNRGLTVYLDSASKTSQSTTFNAEVLIVAGGGGGGDALGGGGGGGGVIHIPSVILNSTTNYPIFVGNGGLRNTNGENSTAFGAVAAGGGTSFRHNSSDGTWGGSGGGASSIDGDLHYAGGAGGSSLGNNNGTIYGNSGGSQTVTRNGTPCRGAGGGGAGAAAANVNVSSVASNVNSGYGKGGDGIAFSISGTSLYYGGGGGGGAFIGCNYAGNGGLGGGGAGSCNGGLGNALGGGSATNSGQNGSTGDNQAGGNGGANTGGGGGGGSWDQGHGGTGGSGVVIVRYAGSPVASGGVITQTGGYTIHTFNSSGILTTGILHDLSNNNNHGVLQNTANFSLSGNGSINFNGVNDYVSIGNLGNLYTQGTISFWMYSTDISNYRNPFTTCYYGYNASIRFELFSDRNFYIVIGNDQGDYNFFSYSSTLLSPNQWYHVVIVWDTIANTATGYLNGIQKFLGSNTKWPSTMPNVAFGTGFDSEAQRQFQGNMACVKIHNVALTQAEVLNDFNHSKPRFFSNYISTPPSFPNIVTNGLVSWVDGIYSSHDSSWNDISPQKNNASFNNGSLSYPPLFASDAGGIYRFNNGNYATVGPDLRYSICTVMAASRYVGIGGRVVAGVANNVLLGHWNNFCDGFYTDGWVRLPNYYTIGNSAAVSDTKWRIYAATSNVGDNTYGFYINGAYTVTNPNGGSRGFQGGVELGGFQGLNETSNSEVAVVLIYDRVLSQSEILQNHAALRTRFKQSDGSINYPFGSPDEASRLGATSGNSYYFQFLGMQSPTQMLFQNNYYDGKPFCKVFSSPYASANTLNLLDLNIPMNGLLVQRNTLDIRAAVYFSNQQVYNTTNGIEADSGYAYRKVMLGHQGGHGIYNDNQNVCNWGDSVGSVGAGFDGGGCGSFPDYLIWGTGQSGSNTYTNRSGTWDHWVYWVGDNLW